MAWAHSSRMLKKSASLFSPRGWIRSEHLVSAADLVRSAGCPPIPSHVFSTVFRSLRRWDALSCGAPRDSLRCAARGRGSMSLPTLYISRLLPDPVMTAARRQFQLSTEPRDVSPSWEALQAGLREADAAICTLTDRLDAAVLADVPRLRIVANYAVGYNNIDLTAATTHGHYRHQHAGRADRIHRRPHLGFDVGGCAACGRG